MWAAFLLAGLLGINLGFIIGVFFASAVIHSRYEDADTLD